MPIELPTPSAPSQVGDLVYLTDVRSELNMSPDMDEKLIRAIKRAQAMLESKTNRLWCRRQSFTQIFFPEDRATFVRLDLYPVLNVVSVSGRKKNVLESAATLIDAANYYTNPNGRLVRVPEAEDCGLFWDEVVKVVYDGGYTADDCPPDVQEAIVQQVGFTINRWAPDKAHVTSVSRDKSSSSFITSDMHPMFEAVCKLHRRITV